MISVDIVLDHYPWKQKIKNPKLHIKKKILKLNKLKLFGVVGVEYEDGTYKTIQEILADKIWNGRVAQTFEHSGYAITINGKQRAGSVIMGYLKNARKYES